MSECIRKKRYRVQRETVPDFSVCLRIVNEEKIDLIVTNYISRFARNTVTLLSTIRDLKRIGVDIRFEEQGIHNMRAEGELMLTILASYTGR